jgi:Zn-dependent M16 (insulinase) family peptidase
MGSRKYPYKGVLDKIATRSYSDTNAWTDNSETVYTLSSAGWAGFAQLLPIYLDHLIVPTLTDAGCYTEVHHVDGKGEDAGLVTLPRNYGHLLTTTELFMRRCKHVKTSRVT